MKTSLLLITTLTAFFLGSGLYNTFLSKSQNAPQTSSNRLTILYSKWAATHGKISHSPSELLFRIAQFGESLKKLPLFRAQNREAVYALTENSDLTDQEFSEILKKNNSFKNLKGRQFSSQKPNQQQGNQDSNEEEEESDEEKSENLSIPKNKDHTH